MCVTVLRYIRDVCSMLCCELVMRKKDDEKLKRFAAIRDELRVSLEPFDNVLMENNRLHENLQVLLHDLGEQRTTTTSPMNSFARSSSENLQRKNPKRARNTRLQSNSATSIHG